MDRWINGWRKSGDKDVKGEQGEEGKSKREKALTISPSSKVREENKGSQGMILFQGVIKKCVMGVLCTNAQACGCVIVCQGAGLKGVDGARSGIHFDTLARQHCLPHNNFQAGRFS